MPITAGHENWYQCSCDICGVMGVRAPRADLAAAAFSGVHGRYLCGPCRQMHGHAPEQTAAGLALNIARDHMAEDLRRAMDDQVFAALDAEESRIRADAERLIELLRRDYPDIDLEPGSGARAALEALSRNPAARARFVDQAPTERLATLVGIASIVWTGQHAGVEMLPAVPAKIEPLPDWFREGSLLRRVTDGALVRIRTINESYILFSLGTTGTFTWPRTSTSKIAALFEPVPPTTRWKLLLDDEE